MRIRDIFYALIAIPLFFSCIKDDKKEAGESLIVTGQKIPAFSVTGNQKTFDSSALDAKITLITFFYPGCNDCKRVFPPLNYVWDNLQDDSRFEMVNIGRDLRLDEIPDEWLEMPCYPDPDRQIYNQFATATIPRIYIVGDDGRVKQMWVEYLRDEKGNEISPEAFLDLIEGWLERP